MTSSKESFIFPISITRSFVDFLILQEVVVSISSLGFFADFSVIVSPENIYVCAVYICMQSITRIVAKNPKRR